jgi:hypothetical protein
VLTSASAAQRRRGLHLGHPHRSLYKPQYKELGEGGRSGVLTGEAVGVVVADDVEGGNFD